MLADFLVLILARAELAATVAILAVLAIRPLARRLIGPELAYGLWALVPIATVTSLFPTLGDFASGPESSPDVLAFMVGRSTLFIPRALTFTVGRPSIILSAYVLGALAMLTIFAIGEGRFRRLALKGRAGPAVMGLGWPRMIVPADFASLFTAPERRLIRAHEQTHMHRGDPRGAALIAAMQLFGWFNPLMHLAARCARLDQELACDAAVIERNPDSRRLYAETLLKAHSGKSWSAFACAMADGGRHPQEVRIGCLRRAPVSVRRYVVGAAILGSLALMMAVGVWTLAPQTVLAIPPPEHLLAPGG